MNHRRGEGETSPANEHQCNISGLAVPDQRDYLCPVMTADTVVVSIVCLWIHCGIFIARFPHFARSVFAIRIEKGGGGESIERSTQLSRVVVCSIVVCATCCLVMASSSSQLNTHMLSSVCMCELSVFSS